MIRHLRPVFERLERRLQLAALAMAPEVAEAGPAETSSDMSHVELPAVSIRVEPQATCNVIVCSFGDTRARLVSVVGGESSWTDEAGSVRLAVPKQQLSVTLQVSDDSGAHLPLLRLELSEHGHLLNLFWDSNPSDTNRAIVQFGAALVRSMDQMSHGASGAHDATDALGAAHSNEHAVDRVVSDHELMSMLSDSLHGAKARSDMRSSATLSPNREDDRVDSLLVEGSHGMTAPADSEATAPSSASPSSAPQEITSSEAEWEEAWEQWSGGAQLLADSPPTAEQSDTPSIVRAMLPDPALVAPVDGHLRVATASNRSPSPARDEDSLPAPAGPTDIGDAMPTNEPDVQSNVWRLAAASLVVAICATGIYVAERQRPASDENSPTRDA